MNYEKIIIELLGRIQSLEERVDALEGGKKTDFQISTGDIRDYIVNQKDIAKKAGKSSIILVAREIHKELNLKSRFPMVCNAMRQCMKPGDIILFQPPKGYSSTLEIQYKI